MRWIRTSKLMFFRSNGLHFAETADNAAESSTNTPFSCRPGGRLVNSSPYCLARCACPWTIRAAETTSDQSGSQHRVMKVWCVANASRSTLHSLCTNHTWSTPTDSNASASQTTKRDGTSQRGRSTTSGPVDDTVPRDGVCQMLPPEGPAEMESRCQ